MRKPKINWSSFLIYFQRLPILIKNFRTKVFLSSSNTKINYKVKHAIMATSFMGWVIYEPTILCPILNNHMQHGIIMKPYFEGRTIVLFCCKMIRCNVPTANLQSGTVLLIQTIVDT